MQMFRDQKEQSLNKSRKTKKRLPRKSQWSVLQQKLYVQFLKRNVGLMKTQESRRANKVFKRLSEFMESRSAVQVKSHHQKLLEKYQTTSSVIHHIELSLKKHFIPLSIDKIPHTQDNPFMSKSVDDDGIAVEREDHSIDRMYLDSPCSKSFFVCYREEHQFLDFPLIVDDLFPIM